MSTNELKIAADEAKKHLEKAEKAYSWLMSAARRQKVADGCDAVLHKATMQDLSAAMMTASLELNNARAEEFMARVRYEKSCRK